MLWSSFSLPYELNGFRNGPPNHQNCESREILMKVCSSTYADAQTCASAHSAKNLYPCIRQEVMRSHTRRSMNGRTTHTVRLTHMRGSDLRAVRTHAGLCVCTLGWALLLWFFMLPPLWMLFFYSLLAIPTLYLWNHSQITLKHRMEGKWNKINQIRHKRACFHNQAQIRRKVQMHAI